MRPSDLAAATRTRADLKSGAARQVRIATGVSGAEVARELQRRGCPVTAQAVFYWETGVNTPTVEHALAYGRVLAALAGPGVSGLPGRRLLPGKGPGAAVSPSRSCGTPFCGVRARMTGGLPGPPRVRPRSA